MFFNGLHSDTNLSKLCNLFLFEAIFHFDFAVIDRLVYCTVIVVFIHQVALDRRYEGTFRFSRETATCLPHAMKVSHCPFLLLNFKQGSCEDQFYSLRFDPIENRTRVYRFKADALSTRLPFNRIIKRA